jgi:flagellar protein FlgJ
VGDLPSGLSALGLPSPIPLSGASAPGFSREDARLLAEDPEKKFADLLKAPAEKEAALPPDPPLPGRARKPVIDKSSKLYEACRELETFLLKTVLTTMRSTVQKSGLIDQGFAGEMYEDMLYDEYAKDFAKNAGFGFADLAYLEVTGQRGKAISRYA